jgi:hypothetical protein
MTDAPVTSLNVCIIGGGASGVGLAWCLARAQQLGLSHDQWQITLLHQDATLGGHSNTVPITMNGETVHLDLGVQMIAPTMYPAVASMLALPDFANVALDPVELRLACAFPPVNGATPYWGNFVAYQDTELYSKGKRDCVTFEALMQAKAIDHSPLEWLESLEHVLDVHQASFADLPFFEMYFLDPYMSIMNGYGAALLEKVILADIAPLFDLGLASMTQQTSGFGRFHGGAGAWVLEMAAVAQAHFGAQLDIRCGADVTALRTLSRDSGGPTVTWTESGQPAQTQTFDYVVSTLDLHTVAGLLAGDVRWSFYEPFIGTPTEYGTSVWDLQPGYCYLHQDRTVLAPGLQSGNQETLQFTAPDVSKTPDGYDLAKTYTTYIESNLLGITLENPADEWYLTMYGFDPTTVEGLPVPASGTINQQMQWEHGMWLPSFMTGPKLAFHTAQGVSPHAKPYTGQQDTRVWFAGNNLTMDSEEGAFMSAMAIAEFVFGIDAPQLVASADTRASAWATIEFDVLYHLMFPPHILDTARRAAHHLEALLHHLRPLRHAR